MPVETRRASVSGVLASAARSYGVITTVEAARLGVDRKQLQRLVARGVLVRAARGLYRLPGTGTDLRARAHLAVVRTSGVLSHQTAASLWGYELAGADPAFLHVTVAHRTNRVSTDGIVVHRSRRPVGTAFTTVAGLPVTRPMRTLVDMASQDVDDNLIKGFLEFCVASRLMQVGPLRRFLAERHRGVGGLACLRRIAAVMWELDSAAEAELIDVLLSSGIDRPRSQFAVRDNGRFVARVDLAWPERKIALELDGYRYHSDHRTFVDDRERGNRIVAAGWTLLRTTPQTVRDAPHSLVRDLQASFTRAPAV